MLDPALRNLKTYKGYIDQRSQVQNILEEFSFD